MSPAAAVPEVNALLAGLAKFTAAGAGVTRFAYDDAWRHAHSWLAAQARAAGLGATADAAGNLYFHPPDVRPGDLSRAVLLTGSHLDTVREGGAYDGAYGAAAGLVLAARHLGPGGLPVVGFVSCEEEGSRFSDPFLGARSLLGRVTHADLLRTRDSGGVSWGAALDALRAHGGAAPVGGRLTEPFPPVFRVARFLELHIEQGPVLEAEGGGIGVVEAIAGYVRVEARFRGAARHAGTTSMRLRKDALAAAAECVGIAEALARDHGDPAVATAGRIEAGPGLFNVVPGQCTLWLEARHSNPGALAAMISRMESDCRAAAARRGVALDWEVVSRQAPVALDAAMAAEAGEHADASAIAHRRMVSGAGHDAMIFAGAGVPSLMLFVPSRDGISHSPEEFTSPEDLARGVEFADELVRRLRRVGCPGGITGREAVDVVNGATDDEARDGLARCCGAARWVDRMLEGRPFASAQAVFERAEVVWGELGPGDWREAFTHHPRIGDVASLRKKFAATAEWAGAEQAGASGAPDAILQDLARGNAEYEARFGTLFIVCATGRSAGEMLELLNSRLRNEPDAELQVAAGEQAKITALRLGKWMRGET